MRSQEPLSAASGDSLMMFSAEKGSFFGLNDIAATIWQRIESPITVAALCAGLQQSFDVAPDRCEAEVLAFLKKLESKGLLRIVA